MALKSQIQIDLNSSEFDDFKEKFQQYQEALAAQPRFWEDIGERIKTASAHLDQLGKAASAQGRAARENDEDEKQRLTRLRDTERLWVSIGKSSSFIAKNVLDVGAGLLKWGGFLVGGLVGGSLFGIDKLAGSAADSRRSATGLGLSVGEHKAFDTDFSRFVDPDHFLSGINEAVSDVSKQGPLYGLGVNPNQSAAQVAIDALKALRALSLATPENMLGTTFGARGLNQFTDLESFRRLGRGTSPEEFNAQLARYPGDVRALGFSDSTGKAWQDFTTQMERAAQTLEKVLIGKLVPLAGPLTNLSNSVVHAFERFADGGAIKTAIDTTAEWFDQLAGNVAKPDFLQKIEQFTSDMGTLGDIVHGVADAAKDPIGAVGKAVVADATKGQLARWDAIKNVAAGVWGSLAKDSAYKHLSSLEEQYGLPKGIGAVIWGKESSQQFHPADQPGPNGAQGPFQIKPSMGGGADLHNFDQASDQALKILREELKHYHGDIPKAIAAYHLGEPALDRIIRRFGDQWQKQVPYVTDIKITNATGNNLVAVVSAFTQ